MAVKRLVLGPGAMAYFAFMGALSALGDAGELSELESISGSSAGSLLGFIYILAKGDMSRVFEYSTNVPVKTIMKPNIRTFLKSFGLVSTDKLYKVFQKMLGEFIPGRQDITFKELYVHWPIRLYVAACCVNLSVTHYFSVDVTPEMSVLKAVCMSVAVPFLIESVTDGTWRYIDGGTLEETPCGPFIGQDNVHVICVTDWSIGTEMPDMKSYMVGIVGAAMALRHKYRYFPKTMIEMSTGNIFDFTASIDSKLKMFLEGYESYKTREVRVEIDPLRTRDEEPQTDPEHPEPTCVSEQSHSHTPQSLPVEPTSPRPEYTFRKSEDTGASKAAECTPLRSSTIDCTDSTTSGTPSDPF
jgi:predicted acylesterase/phospholipase RssA